MKTYGNKKDAARNTAALNGKIILLMMSYAFCLFIFIEHNQNFIKQMTLIRSIAVGVLLSMLFTFAMHYFGEWKMENYRPDPETTSSVVVYNKCAVFNDVHILRPNTTSSGNDVTNELKLTGSFMNFFDGHVVAMIIIAIILGLIIFVIRTGLKKNIS